MKSASVECRQSSSSDAPFLQAAAATAEREENISRLAHKTALNVSAAQALAKSAKARNKDDDEEEEESQRHYEESWREICLCCCWDFGDAAHEVAEEDREGKCKSDTTRGSDQLDKGGYQSLSTPKEKDANKTGH
jgi:hypothetical protein